MPSHRAGIAFGPFEDFAYTEELTTDTGVSFLVVSKRPRSEVLYDWAKDAVMRARRKRSSRPRIPRYVSATQTPITA